MQLRLVVSSPTLMRDVGHLMKAKLETIKGLNINTVKGRDVEGAALFRSVNPEGGLTISIKANHQMMPALSRQGATI